jgi:threonine synthase
VKAPLKAPIYNLGLIDRWRKYLPVSAKTPVITLTEGCTPLIPASALSALVDAGKTKVKIHLKYEGLNPTGSFKDRGMTLAVSKAAEAGAKAILCASTGNTSASAAAYAARAGMKCVVLLPKGSIALGKLAQALVSGATALAVEGNFDDALKMAREASTKLPLNLVNSVNPYRLQGQKTGAFEVMEQLAGQAPDFHAIPVGNAGNIAAYWMGYTEGQKHGMTRKLPKMLGFQAAGSAPIVKGYPIKNPKTIATAIKIGNPASWSLAQNALDESDGEIDSVTDGEIIKAYLKLTRLEGVFCEPASAASLAGVLKLSHQGYFRRQAKLSGKKEINIVCVLTGHGLKDPDRAIALSPAPKVIPPTLSAMAKALGW